MSWRAGRGGERLAPVGGVVAPAAACAVSFDARTGTPMTATAVCMSRIAVQARPVWPRSRLAASQNSAAVTVAVSRYRPRGDDRSAPSSDRRDAAIEPEDASLENQPLSANSH